MTTTLRWLMIINWSLCKTPCNGCAVPNGTHFRNVERLSHTKKKWPANRIGNIIINCTYFIRFACASTCMRAANKHTATQKTANVNPHTHTQAERAKARVIVAISTETTCACAHFNNNNKTFTRTNASSAFAATLCSRANTIRPRRHCTASAAAAAA